MPGLSMAETRAHFGSWAIVSSPLTLSMDVNNDTIMDQAEGLTGTGMSRRRAVATTALSTHRLRLS